MGEVKFNFNVGNFVDTPNPHMNPLMITVVEFDKIGGYHKANFGSVVHWLKKSVNPILLNQFWLREIGFLLVDDNIDNAQYTLDDFDVFVQSNEVIVFFYLGNEIKNIKYVHQLQNLITSLKD